MTTGHPRPRRTLRVALVVAPWVLLAAFVASDAAEAKPKPTPSPKTQTSKANKAPSIDWGSMPSSLAKPGGDAARVWVSSYLEAGEHRPSGNKQFARVDIHIINPDRKKKVSAKVTCYRNGKTIDTRTVHAGPLDRTSAPVGGPGWGKQVCSVEASGPVFAYASSWGHRYGATESTATPHRERFIPMFRAAP